MSDEASAAPTYRWDRAGLVRAVGDVRFGPVLLEEPAAFGVRPVMRVYQPLPTVAFAARDCRSPAIAAAARAAMSAGHAPVRRGPGGRPVAYHGGSVCLDVVGAEAMEARDTRRRFEVYGECLASALRVVGVPAEVGPVPGEYCPGEFSVNDGDGHKLVGTAQRLTKGAWLFSAVIHVGGAEALRAVTTSVYSELQLAWDADSLGSVDGLVPGTGTQAVAAAVTNALSQHADLLPADGVDEVLQKAVEGADRHLLSIS